MRWSGAADDCAGSGGNRCGHCGVIGGFPPAFFTNGRNFAWGAFLASKPHGDSIILNFFSKIWVDPREKISANLGPSPAFGKQPKVSADFTIFIAHWPPQPTVPHGFCLRFSCAT